MAPAPPKAKQEEFNLVVNIRVRALQLAAGACFGSDGGDDVAEHSSNGREHLFAADRKNQNQSVQFIFTH